MTPNPTSDGKAKVSKPNALARLEALPPTYFFAPDVEREINRLESVTSAKVLSTGAVIEEIHVIAPRMYRPKKVVRDIESLLLVRFGIRIDHRCVSIVRMDGMLTEYAQNTRPRIEQVTQEKGTVRLALSVANKTLVGEATARAGESELEVTGRAAIHALEQVLQTPGVLTLLQTHVVEMAKHQVVLVMIRWLFGDQEELLIGASLVHQVPVEAMARATLDAVNRRLVRFQATVG